MNECCLSRNTKERTERTRLTIQYLFELITCDSENEREARKIRKMGKISQKGEERQLTEVLYDVT